MQYVFHCLFLVAYCSFLAVKKLEKNYNLHCNKLSVVYQMFFLLRITTLLSTRSLEGAIHQPTTLCLAISFYGGPGGSNANKKENGKKTCGWHENTILEISPYAFFLFTSVLFFISVFLFAFCFFLFAFSIFFICVFFFFCLFVFYFFYLRFLFFNCVSFFLFAFSFLFVFEPSGPP